MNTTFRKAMMNRVGDHAGFARAVIAFLLAFALAFTLTPGLAFATQAGAADDSQVVAEQVGETTGLDASDEDADENGAENAAVSEEDSNAAGEDQAAESVLAVASEDADESIETQEISTQDQPYSFEQQDGNLTIGIENFNINSNGETPLNFTVSGASNSANCYFTIDYLMLDSYDEYVCNTNEHWTSSNPFKYQFLVKGTYRITVSAYEQGTNNRGTATLVFNNASGTSTSELAQSIAKNATGNDFDKVLYVHDYLINHATEKADSRHCGASGALLYGEGNSESFFRAVQLIMNQKGLYLPVQQAEADGRMWPIITISGNRTHVDVGRDSQLKSSYPYLFFGLNDELIKRVRPSYVPRPNEEATSLASNYYLKDGRDKIESHIASVDSQMTSLLNQGRLGFELVAGDFGNSDANAILPSIVALDLSKASQSNGTYVPSKALVKYIPESRVYRIAARVLSGDNPYFQIQDMPSVVVADGTHHTQNLVAVLNGDVLQKDRDYTVTTTNDIDPGYVTVTVAGKGDNTGSYTFTYQILSSAMYPVNATGSWVKSGGRWWYRYDGNTQAVQGKEYPVNEWVNIGGKRYHFDDAGWMSANWLSFDNGWYWLGSDGAMKTGWIKTGGKWYYLDPAFSSNIGKMKTGMQNIDGANYYLRPSNGDMATGWVDYDGSWYWFNSSGAMHYGWIKTGGVWYYLDGDNGGKMVTGRKTVGDATYIFNESSGAMFTGWVWYGGYWFWCNSSGAIVGGWLRNGGHWYYLDPSSGIMQTGKQGIDDKTYYLDPSSGAMRTGWVQIEGVWYYFNSSGAMVTNSWISGKYYVDSNGVMATDTIIDGKWHVNGEGVWDYTI